MAQSTAFGSVDSGNIAEVRFREGSLLTRNAGIVTIGSIMAACSEDLDASIKMNLLHTTITKSAPIYDAEFDEGNGADMDFVNKCVEFHRYLDGLGPVGSARNGIGYVTRSCSALSTARDAKGNNVDMFLYGIPPECVDDVKVYKNGWRAGGNLMGIMYRLRWSLRPKASLRKRMES